jgi:pseudaminic acid biosynthesis-associated methylase
MEDSMAKDIETNAEVTRLEQLWAGDFGDAYVDRNRSAGDVRNEFWKSLLQELPVESVLEIGCNLGQNLKWIGQSIDPGRVFGIDINAKALAELRKNESGINAIWCPARDLPFRDRWFDLVFTMGVLIHQPESTLPLVMAEIVRCSRRYVLCGEYFAEQATEVPYREQEGALFKRNYGRIYQELFPELKLVKQGFMGRDMGWDDITYWVFEK